MSKPHDGAYYWAHIVDPDLGLDGWVIVQARHDADDDTIDLYRCGDEENVGQWHEGMVLAGPLVSPAPLSGKYYWLWYSMNYSGEERKWVVVEAADHSRWGGGMKLERPFCDEGFDWTPDMLLVGPIEPPSWQPSSRAK